MIGYIYACTLTSLLWVWRQHWKDAKNNESFSEASHGAINALDNHKNQLTQDAYNEIYKSIENISTAYYE